MDKVYRKIAVDLDKYKVFQDLKDEEMIYAVPVETAKTFSDGTVITNNNIETIQGYRLNKFKPEGNTIKFDIYHKALIDIPVNSIKVLFIVNMYF